MIDQPTTKPDVNERVIHLPRGRTLLLSRPLVMGILNVTPDSFFDGGRYETVDAAVSGALQLVDEGADLVDIGGQSSRPGSDPIDAGLERDRVLPVIEAVRRISDVPISVDTYRASVAGPALDAGADLINDISALRYDPELTELLADTESPVILMHMKGNPRDMQKAPHYEDCVGEIERFLEERIEHCRRYGIEESRVVIDPGIGFGKRLEDNLAILSHLDRLKRFGRPILVGASRKSFMATISADMKDPDHRLAGSLAASIMAVDAGADMVRVHDVAATVRALQVVQAVREAR